MTTTTLHDLRRRLAAIGPQVAFGVGNDAGEPDTTPAWVSALRTDAEDSMASGLRTGIAAGLALMNVFGPVVNVVTASFTLDGIHLPPGSVTPRFEPTTRRWQAVVDPRSAYHHTGGPDVEHARHQFAHDLVDHVDIGATQARRVGRFAQRWLWGNVIDRVAVITHLVAPHGPPRAVTPFQIGHAVAAAVRSASPCADVPLPTELAIDVDSTITTFVDKGTCCAIYLLDPTCARATGAGFCTTCPLIDQTIRRQRLTAWLTRPEEPAP